MVVHAYGKKFKMKELTKTLKIFRNSRQQHFDEQTFHSIAVHATNFDARSSFSNSILSCNQCLKSGSVPASANSGKVIDNNYFQGFFQIP